jgi:hypothetical protein
LLGGTFATGAAAGAGVLAARRNPNALRALLQRARNLKADFSIPSR